uniref:DNA-(apurinic or apyrimidinic site) lyase n=1 Tax=Spongospora subterranea TaxID=70186 RepID=A0A0H5QNE2_9EUKA|eukprot:CRZ03092.1 hypothetical protein [Spongospora subterranea]
MARRSSRVTGNAVAHAGARNNKSNVRGSAAVVGALEGRLIQCTGTWSDWLPIDIKPGQFWAKGTLTNGQCFGWRHQPGIQEDDQFTGVLCDQVLQIRQSDPMSMALYRVAIPHHNNDQGQVSKSRTRLHHFLRSDADLSAHYKQWASSDLQFSAFPEHFAGIRLLQQDPVECLFSFICSSNNHITRITSILNKLRDRFGVDIMVVDGVVYKQFPTIASLAASSEEELKSLGLGYRARYIHQTAIALSNRPDNFLHDFHQRSQVEIQTELCQLMGIGRKVADCISLFSMNQLQVVPVDTHVLQIALKHYRDRIGSITKSQTLTPKVYNQISTGFVSVFGELAGWAHSILFTADLPQFRDHLSPKKLDTNLETGTAAEFNKTDVKPETNEVKCNTEQLDIKLRVNLKCESDGIKRKIPLDSVLSDLKRPTRARRCL